MEPSEIRKHKRETEDGIRELMQKFIDTTGTKPTYLAFDMTVGDSGWYEMIEVKMDVEI